MRRLAVVGALVLLVLAAGCAGFTFEVETESGAPDAADRASPDCEIGPGTSNATTPDSAPPAANGTLSVHYVDVGQADATFVRGPANETMLIDTGHWDDDGEVVLNYLEAHDVERIDYLVSTHAHADHIGGSAAVIEHYETEHDGIGSVWDSGVPHTSNTYDEYLDAIETHDVTLYETQVCDEIPMPGATVDVLNPPVEHGEGDLDANAVALRIAHGDAGFLFTGDMTSQTEPDLVDRWGSGLQSTVYQAGHHGSSTSSSAGFLDTVDPRLAVVSSAYDSEYGHPHEEPLARFAERGVETYWTGTHGTVVATTGGDAVTVRTVANATTDPTALTSAPPAGAPVTAETAIRETYDAGDDADAESGAGAESSTESDGDAASNSNALVGPPSPTGVQAPSTLTAATAGGAAS